MTLGPMILIIEDEIPIRRFLKASLVNENYRVVEADSGEQGLRLAVQQPPDGVILDLGLPDMDGHQVMSQLREWYSGPVIILSARDQEQEKIHALDQGADDYVTKPFAIGELLARLRTAFRHYQPNRTEESQLTIDTLTIDFARHAVIVRGQPVHLTPLEFKLLGTMAKQAGRVLTHRYLLREVWGPLSSQENHYLRVFVAGLRRKIEQDPARPRFIITEQGVGYRFAAE